MTGASPLEHRDDSVADPYLSICIPQYNRTSFLLEALRSMEQQTFANFEVCISDDCSTDGRAAEILEFLERSRLSYVYRRRERNGRYDANLRSAIALARGKYCLLLGNDDVLTSPDSLRVYSDLLRRHEPLGVATCNFRDESNGREVRRITQTRRLPGGPRTAVTAYRNFSAVSGVVLRTEPAQRHATSRWDGGEMYQTYLASRIIAEGDALLYVDQTLVGMGTVIPGESVDSVLRRQRIDPCPIIERTLPLAQLGRIVADAISSSTPRPLWERYTELIVAQLYLFPYPYWLITYRSAQSWRYAVGICLGMRPRHVLAGLPLPLARRLRLTLLFGLVSAAGLLVPPTVFDAARSPLFRLAKLLR